MAVGGHKVAIYWTMGVDCGADSELAAKVVRHFDGFIIDLQTFAPIACKAHTETHRDIRFVCVHPRGMGRATLPETERRPELANDHCESAVRDILYAELHGLPGFRRAMFGGECFDQLAFATSDEDADIAYDFMISSVAAFPDLPSNCQCESFADGYRIVTSVHR